MTKGWSCSSESRNKKRFQEPISWQEKGGRLNHPDFTDTLGLGVVWKEAQQGPHQRRRCYRKTPAQIFLDTVPLAKEKMLGV